MSNERQETSGATIDIMKRLLLFIVLFLLGFFVVLFYNRWHEDRVIQQAKKETPVIPEKDAFSLEKAPKDSLKATIVSFSGEVFWESRVATEPAKLASLRNIQQGEMVVTGNDGHMKLVFSDHASLVLDPKTSLSLIQTLPQSLVFGQDNGVVRYTKVDSLPLSVRAMHLLTVLENPAELRLAVDPDDGLVTITVLNGSAIVAFNSLDNIAQTVRVEERQYFVFNDETREGRVE